MSFLEEVKAITKQKISEERETIDACKLDLHDMICLQVEEQARKGFSSYYFSARELPNCVSTYHNALLQKGRTPPFRFEVLAFDHNTKINRYIINVVEKMFQSEGFTTEYYTEIKSLAIKW